MLYKHDVTSEIQKKALEYLMFLKQKQLGKVKACGCADRCPQREYLSKDNLSLPMVSIYTLMAQCVMSAMEEQKFVTCDILGAFLQSDWPDDDDDFYIKFEGMMVKMLCKINPSYKRKVLYTRDNQRKFLNDKLEESV